MTLTCKYGLKIGKPPCSTIEIEKDLLEVPGTGADIIVDGMRSFLR